MLHHLALSLVAASTIATTSAEADGKAIRTGYLVVETRCPNAEAIKTHDMLFLSAVTQDLEDKAEDEDERLAAALSACRHDSVDREVKDLVGILLTDDLEAPTSACADLHPDDANAKRWGDYGRCKAKKTLEQVHALRATAASSHDHIVRGFANALADVAQETAEQDLDIGAQIDRLNKI